MFFREMDGIVFKDPEANIRILFGHFNIFVQFLKHTYNPVKTIIPHQDFMNEKIRNLRKGKLERIKNRLITKTFPRLARP